MRQVIFIEHGDCDKLREGEIIPVVFGGQECGLGSDVRTRKAIDAKTLPQPSNGKSNGVGRKRWAYKNGELTITERVFRYLEKNGPKRAIEIADEMKVDRTAVSSALSRFRGIRVRRVGKLGRAVWRIK